MRLGPLAPLSLPAAEPPAINPFERPPEEKRDPSTDEAKDAGLPGSVELSNGQVLPGLISLTRDTRLKIYDERLERQRAVPLQAIKQIDCKVKREWIEREWRFKETASDEKVYTGRRYPVREYLHTITLADDRKITGPLSALVYLRPPRGSAPSSPSESPSARDKEARVEQFVLHKRDKGGVGQELKALVYVKRIRLGRQAYDEAERQREQKKHGP